MIYGIQEIGMDGPYFCVKLKNEEKLWKFKLQCNDLIAKWITLVFFLKEQFSKKRN